MADQQRPRIGDRVVRRPRMREVMPSIIHDSPVRRPQAFSHRTVYPVRRIRCPYSGGRPAPVAARIQQSRGTQFLRDSHVHLNFGCDRNRPHRRADQRLLELLWPRGDFCPDAGRRLGIHDHGHVPADNHWSPLGSGRAHSHARGHGRSTAWVTWSE